MRRDRAESQSRFGQTLRFDEEPGELWRNLAQNPNGRLFERASRHYLYTGLFTIRACRESSRRRITSRIKEKSSFSEDDFAAETAGNLRAEKRICFFAAARCAGLWHERLRAFKSESPRARLSNERITSGSALGITLDVPIKIERREHGEY